MHCPALLAARLKLVRGWGVACAGTARSCLARLVARTYPRGLRRPRPFAPSNDVKVPGQRGATVGFAAVLPWLLKLKLSSVQLK